MTNRIIIQAVACAGALVAVLHAGSTPSGSAVRARLDNSYGKLPLQFEANQGQQPAPVKFLSRGKDYTLFLTPDGATLSLRKFEPEAVRKALDPTTNGPRVEAAADLRLKLEGGNPDVRLSGADPLPGMMNYFIGKDHAKWRTNIQTYGKVRYDQVYPGIDLVFYGNQRQLEYDFVVAPGATPDAIRLCVEGADHTSVDNATGDLVLQAAGQEIRFHKPVVYQPESDASPRRQVDGRFDVNQNRVSFEVASYDHARPLVVDPVLAYSTFLGGSNEDDAMSVAVDKAGNTYVTGYTCSSNFPTTAGSYSPTQPVQGAGTGCNGVLNASGMDVFISKLNPAGSALIYSTYLGGSYQDTPRSIGVDSSGNAYVAGVTVSADFPVTNDSVCAPLNVNIGNCVFAVESTCEGGAGPQGLGTFGSFVTKLNPTGSALVWSTLMGGTGNDNIAGMAIDGSANLYLAVNSSSSPGQDIFCSGSPETNYIWPTTANAYEENFPTAGWENDFHQAFTQMNSDGVILYSTFFGAPSSSTSTGGVTYFSTIAVDSAGNAYIGGSTNTSNYPVTAGAYQTACDACVNGHYENGLITAFDPNQTGAASLLFSTFLGGSGISRSGSACPNPDNVNAVALDSASDVYATGSACSADFPTTHGAYQTTNPQSCNDAVAFLSILNSTGSTLKRSTFLGGSSCGPTTIGYGVSVDSAGDGYVTGSTSDPSFPTVNPLQTSSDDGSAFVSQFNKTASELLFSTQLGYSGYDEGNGIHADNYGNIYVVGETSGSAFPTTMSAFQTTYGGDSDGFVTRISLTQADLAVTNSALQTVLSGTALTYTIAVSNNGPDSASDITLTDDVPKGTSFVSATPTTGS